MSKKTPVVAAKKISNKAEITLNKKAKRSPVIAAKSSLKKTTVRAVKSNDKKTVYAVKATKVSKREEAVIKSEPKAGIHEKMARYKVATEMEI